MLASAMQVTGSDHPGQRRRRCTHVPTVMHTFLPQARYKPAYKVAPEWEQLGSTEEDGGAGGGGERLTDAARDGDVQAAADAGGGPSGGRRRLRAHSAAAGGVGNPDRSSHHNQLTDAPGSGSSSAEGAGTNTQSGGQLLHILDTLAPHHVAHHVAVRGRLLAGGSLEGEPRYGVSAHLLPAAPAEVLEAAEADWPAALAATLAAQGAGGGEGAQGGNGTNSGSNGGGGGCYPVVLAPRDVSSGHVLGGTWGPGAAVLDIYLCERVRHGAGIYQCAWHVVRVCTHSRLCCDWLSDQRGFPSPRRCCHTSRFPSLSGAPPPPSVLLCCPAFRCLHYSPESLSTLSCQGPAARRAVAGAAAASDLGSTPGAAAAGQRLRGRAHAERWGTGLSGGREKQRGGSGAG